MHRIASISWGKKKTKQDSYTLETHTIDLFDLIRSSEMQDYYDGGKEQLEDNRPGAVLSFNRVVRVTAPTTQNNGRVE